MVGKYLNYSQFFSSNEMEGIKCFVRRWIIFCPRPHNSLTLQRRNNICHSVPGGKNRITGQTVPLTKYILPKNERRVFKFKFALKPISDLIHINSIRNVLLKRQGSKNKFSKLAPIQSCIAFRNQYSSAPYEKNTG